MVVKQKTGFTSNQSRVMGSVFQFLLLVKTGHNSLISATVTTWYLLQVATKLSPDQKGGVMALCRFLRSIIWKAELKAGVVSSFSR
jgi:hypothetical protein